MHTRTHQVPQAPEPAAFSVFPGESSRVSCVPCGFFLPVDLISGFVYFQKSFNLVNVALFVFLFL